MARKTKTQARYYKRHRRISLATEHGPGPEVSALITRYRMGAKRRKPRYVYWYEGRWYIAKNLVTERDASGAAAAWQWCLVPATGSAWDAYAAQTLEQGRAALVSLTLKDGSVTSATGAKGSPYAGAQMLDGTETAAYVADLLDLDRPTTTYRPRHMRVA